ncbi:MAG: hypothetical protein KC657_25090 [Myxococcales bacterium]|nr:hypothetical protein [Myxococcales bacterium]
MNARSLFLAAVPVLFACSRESKQASAPPETAPTAPASPSSAAPTTAPSASGASSPAPRAAPASIGVARMLPDGTLELDLRGPGGAESRVVYKPNDAKYKSTLDHLGGMKPGESKPVPPWPDPWDAAKVEAAAHAHAAKKGWKAGEYKVEIMGTDADGHAAVTLHHNDDAHAKSPGSGKSIAIRVETKGYTVVRELGLQ